MANTYLGRYFNTISFRFRYDALLELTVNNFLAVEDLWEVVEQRMDNEGSNLNQRMRCE